MGIDGLLPCLKSVTRPGHVRAYAGQRVAVDSYVWLHRGVFTCARELALGQPTDKYVAYFLRCVEVLRTAGVEPVCVFDGDKLPSKAAEEAERATRREEHRERAEAHERAGNGAAAQECYQRAVDVSPAMAARVIQELRLCGVAFVVAPFEADAQMAHMALSGSVAAVITEDSDLIAYGVPRVFLKMDKQGAGFEVAAAELPRCREMALGGLCGEQFTQLCVLAGCDFCPSITGVGPRKAAQLLRRFRTASAAVRHLRFEGAPVPRDYERTLQDAVWTFAHQFVYDTQLRRCVHRTPLAPGGLPEERVEALLGAPPPPEVAQGVAEGRLDPFTRLPFPPEVFAPVPRSVLRAPPVRAPTAQQRLSIADYFSSPAPRAAGMAAPCFAASTGRKRASLPASAEPSAADQEEEEDAGAVPPSSVKRARTSKAAAVCDTVAGMLHGIFGGAGPTPARAGALCIYADAPPGSVSTGGCPSSSAEESPAKPHPMAMAWVATAASRPLPRPLRPLGNLSKQLAQAAEEPKGRVSSRFFAASPMLAAPAVEAMAAEPAADAIAAAPPMGADVRHCAAFAATAAAALDMFRHGSSARKPASAKRGRGAAAVTPLRRAHADADASPAAAPAGALLLDGFRYTPRDCRAI